jgi:hypothetical protein
MEITFLMVRQSDGVIIGSMLADSPDDGPIIPPQFFPEDGADLVHWAPGFSRVGYSDNYIARLIDGVIEWSDSEDLAAMKLRKSAEINAARLLANQSYFDFADKQIACDEVSMLDIQCINAEVCLTRKIPSTFPGYWKARDNTYTSIPDVATWTLFIQAMVTRGAAHFAHAQKLKSDLAVAATPAQVEAISW